MGLAELSDVGAVQEAMGEFDALGRDGFLSKYGFGQARSYMLLYEGRLYDSKAIAGVAFGRQFPSRGPLAASAFSGGEAGAAKVLRSLGFDVVALELDQQSGNNWALCANPKRYRIREAVQRLDFDWWRVGRSDVRANDFALIWQTLDSDGRRGLVGIAQVLTDPEVRMDEYNPYWVSPDDGGTAERRVYVYYHNPKPLPIWIDDPEFGSLLERLSVSRGRGGTVFRVTDDQWTDLVDVLEAWRPVSPDELAVYAALDPRQRGPSRGQGFGLKASERRAVEAHAMKLAKEYFSKHWPTVFDTSANSPFDLLCRNADEELRVEVKGTTTGADHVLITRREAELATQPGHALFVVAGIKLSRGTEPRASGGRQIVIEPWTIGPSDLTPVTYRCAIDLSVGTVIG